MPTSIPRSVREAWGEEATEDFEQWLRETLRERAVPRDEYREVLSRLDVLEHRLDQIDDRFDQIDQRFSRIDEHFARIDEHFAQINERFDYVHERFDLMHERMLVMMRWTVGTIALFGTLITILLAIAEFAA